MTTALKALAIFAAGILLSLGLCGIGGFHNNAALSVAGLIGFVTSVLGCGVSIVIIAVITIGNYFHK